MSCYGPITAYYPKRASGSKFLELMGFVKSKRLVFNPKESETGIPFQIPCGQCVGCRLDYSRQWAIRCMHEKQMHSASSFITLTYDDKHLPEGNSLSMEHYQLFLKRLRSKFGTGIRFAGCGEYGDTTKRPHYHILLLNFDFNDRKFYKSSEGSGLPLYTSKELDKLWKFGFCNIGNVDYDSCAYVARYVMKKIKGKDTFNSDLYCPETGIVKEPEFFTMSRKPGLGASWYAKFGPHAFQWDSVIFKAMEVPIPRFYDNMRVGPAINDAIKIRRRRKAALNRADNTTRRLRAKEVVAMAKLALKGRKL